MKSYNGGLNIADDGRIVTTLFHELQDQGWKTGTVTSVPFCHASPAGMYAQNVDRDDYQDIARSMLGLPGILQEARGSETAPGPRRRDRHGIRHQGHGHAACRSQGRNAVARQLLPDRRRPGGHRRQERRQVRLRPHREGRQRRPVAPPGRGHRCATRRSVVRLLRSPHLDHLPYRTADGRYDPVPSLDSEASTRSPPRSTPRASWTLNRP